MWLAVNRFFASKEKMMVILKDIRLGLLPKGFINNLALNLVIHTVLLSSQSPLELYFLLLCLQAGPSSRLM
jgi:hypothetical protein